MALGIDGPWDSVQDAPKITQVSDRALFPEYAAACRGGARPRHANDLLAVIDSRRCRSRVAGKRGELLNLPCFRAPNYSSKLEHLWRHTVWVLNTVLRIADHLAPVVDPEGLTVIATKRGERCLLPVLPQESKTGQACTETAEVLPQRIYVGGFAYGRN